MDFKHEKALFPPSPFSLSLMKVKTDAEIMYFGAATTEFIDEVDLRFILKY